MDHAVLMRAYYDAYNSEDEAQLMPLLADDVLLTSAAGEQRGVAAYIATYRWMIANFVDRMTPERIVADAQGATVDIHDRLVARQDVEDFLGGSPRAGDVIILRLTGRYTIMEGSIVQIDIAARAG